MILPKFRRPRRCHANGPDRFDREVARRSRDAPEQCRAREHAWLRGGARRRTRAGWRTRRTRRTTGTWRAAAIGWGGANRNATPPGAPATAAYPLVRQQQSRQRRPFQLRHLPPRPLTRSAQGASAPGDRIRASDRVRRQVQGNRRQHRVRNRTRVQDPAHSQPRRPSFRAYPRHGPPSIRPAR
jgi:hypothetical protein